MYLAEELGLRPMVIPELGRKISPLGDIRAFFSLKGVMKAFRPQIVHTHTAKAGTLGRLAAFSQNLFRTGEKRIRTVHTFHGHVFSGYFNRATTAAFATIERQLSKITDRIIVLSPVQRADVCARLGVAVPEKVQVIPLGFDLSRFKGAAASRDALRTRYFGERASEVFIFGSIGRLTSVKDHALLLRGIRNLIDQGGVDRLRLLVVGDGELRGELTRQVRDLDLRDRVAFCGWQRDMPAFYDALDAVVLTSRNEGTPVTLIEAMAAGKPVIATSVGGVPDLLGREIEVPLEGVYEAERGILVPSGDVEALSRALMRVLSNGGRLSALTLRASAYVMERHSEERLFSDILALYHELAAPSSLSGEPSPPAC